MCCFSRILGRCNLTTVIGLEECQQSIAMIEADALVLHLNPLQEALQIDGNRDFTDLSTKIEKLCRQLETPVIVKEVGFGISTNTARRLKECGVAAIDTSGAGGTSWSAVEYFRAPNPRLARLSSTFADWGIPTATSIEMVRNGASGNSDHR